MWHGAGYKFLVWGIMHASYQILGELTYKLRENLYSFCKISGASKRYIKQIGTFLLVNWAWIIFRADNLRLGMKLIKHMFTEFNPWILFNDRIFTLGLEWKEIVVLVCAICLLGLVDKYHEQGNSVSHKIIACKLPVRWTILIGTIIVIMIFGTYGFGYNAQDFIYGGF